MLSAQAIFDSTCIAPSSRAKPPCTVRTAEPPCDNSIAALGSRAGRFVFFVFGMLETMSFLSCCVGFASPGCADPKRTVLDANTFAIDEGGAAVGMSAGYLLAVLAAMAAPLQSVGYAPHCNTLAVCSVFAAQASRDCFGGAAVHRARLPAVCIAESSSMNGVGAPTNRANLCILPLPPLSFLFWHPHFVQPVLCF